MRACLPQLLSFPGAPERPPRAPMCPRRSPAPPRSTTSSSPWASGGPCDHCGLRPSAAHAGRTLEIGAGTGLNLPYHPAAVTDLVLTEPEPAMASKLRRRVAAGASEPAPPVIPAGAEALPFPDAAFETAVTTMVLCTVPDPDAAVAELRRVAQAGRLAALHRARARRRAARRPPPAPPRSPMDRRRGRLPLHPRHAHSARASLRDRRADPRPLARHAAHRPTADRRPRRGGRMSRRSATPRTAAWPSRIRSSATVRSTSCSSPASPHSSTRSGTSRGSPPFSATKRSTTRLILVDAREQELSDRLGRAPRLDEVGPTSPPSRLPDPRQVAAPILDFVKRGAPRGPSAGSARRAARTPA